jgi:hypothetical protein
MTRFPSRLRASRRPAAKPANTHDVSLVTATHMAGHIKRLQSTKAEVEQRRATLFEIVAAIIRPPADQFEALKVAEDGDQAGDQRALAGLGLGGG